MNNLKLCPFCGHYAYVTYWGKVMCAVDFENRDYFTVFCSNCDANTSAESEDEVVKRWNNRIPTPRKCCGNCKHYLDLSRDYDESVCQHPNRVKDNVAGYDNCDKWESD